MKTKRFEDLEVGDVLVGPGDSDAPITAVYDVHTPELMFELELADGRSVQAGGTHLWYVITADDRAIFGTRKARARRAVKALGASTRKLLDEMAAHPDVLELSYKGLLETLGVTHESPMGATIERVLLSIGPIVEENHSTRDLLTDDLVDEETIAIYDATLASKQILSLAGVRKWKRASPALVGRVVTSEQLAELVEIDEVDIPVL